jgi:hypothetical protein
MAAFLNFSPSGRDKSEGAGGGKSFFSAACHGAIAIAGVRSSKKMGPAAGEKIIRRI